MKDTTLFQTESDLYQRSDIGMYYCGKRILTRNHVYGPEIRNHFLFVLINQGEASFYHRGKTVKLKARDMLVMCPGERIHYVADTPWSIQWVGLYGETVDTYMKELSVNGDHPILTVEHSREMSEVLEDLYRVSRGRSEYLRCRQTELIYRFFSLLLHKSKKPSRYDIAEGAKKIMDYNFERQITVADVADALHLYAAYLTRKFVQKFGIAPKEYLIQKRIDHAKTLLTQSEASIAEIAASVGYVDPLYFSRIFKKKEGVCPREYRGAQP